MARRKQSVAAERAAGKDPDAFRNISETAELLGVRNHVLRFWEQRFTQLKPMKRAGNRRLYRPEDIELLFGIRKLLRDDNYTIKGVQRILRDQGVEAVKEIGRPLDPLYQAAETDDPDAAPAEAMATTAGPKPSAPVSQASSEGLPMLRDAVELAISELELTRAILLGEEPPAEVRAAASA
jgi:DNA-binding transcriptional MerR regulator